MPGCTFDLWVRNQTSDLKSF